MRQSERFGRWNSTRVGASKTLILQAKGRRFWHGSHIKQTLMDLNVVGTNRWRLGVVVGKLRNHLFQHSYVEHSKLKPF